MIDVLIVTPLTTLGTKIIYNQLNNAGLTAKIAIITENSVELVLKYKPRILNINWMFENKTYEFIVNIVPQLKKILPDMKIVYGGYTATYDWQNLKDYEYCDAIVGGEADDSVVECSKDILEHGKIDKLKYLKTPLPDLSKYDYENNMIETDDEIIFETARSCANAMNNRCWYCPQFQTPYRLLDIEKIKESLESKMKIKKKNLTIVNPHVVPVTINELWKTFHQKICCFVLPQHFSMISKDIHGCFFNTGYDIYDDPSLRCNPTAKYLDDIFEVAKNNYVELGSVIIGDTVPEKTLKEMNRVMSISKNINVSYNHFVQYPGVDNKPLEKNIYLNKTKIRPFVAHDETVEEQEEAWGLTDFNNKKLLKTLKQYIIPKNDYKYYDFFDNLIKDQYYILSIENTYSLLVFGNIDNIRDLCIVETIDERNNIYKCIPIKQQ